MRNCTSLKSLSLSKCTDITDDEIRKLLLACSNLVEIDISDTDASDATLQSLCDVNKNIASLAVAQCSKITENGIAHVVRSSPNLVDLIVSAHNSIKENSKKTNE